MPRIVPFVLLMFMSACDGPKVIPKALDDTAADGAGDGGGDDGKPGACPPGAVLGCASGYSKKVCNSKGTKFEEVSCGASKICIGNGECKQAVCVPGSKICQGPSTAAVCNVEGTAYDTSETCPLGLVCVSGVCESSCGSAVKVQTNVGCRYMLIDLGNFESVPENNSDDKPVMVVVSNTSGTNDAHITITSNIDGQPLSYTEAELTVPPQELRTFNLPTGQAQLYTSRNMWSWSLDSDQPVTVHQFNPENGPAVRSNDASLLFPIDSLGTDYVVMSWPSFWTGQKGFDDNGKPKYGFPSYLTVIATAEGTTQVTVVPSTDIGEGNIPGTVATGFLGKGQSRTYPLQKGQVLNLVVDAKVGTFDLTGTTVKADQGVATFVAHNCAFIPSIEVKYCDHLEHQLAPVDTWGTIYVADRFQPRSTQGYDVWRIMAAADGTVVTTDPLIDNVSGKVLGKNEWIQYQGSQPHLIHASQPIQVGHFMIGSNMPDFDPVCGEEKTGIGDPAFTIGVATNQYLNHYVVLTPPGYTNDWLNISRKVGSVVSLDGQAIEAGGIPVGGSGYELVRMAVQDGVHILDGDLPFGVTAYGYNCDVSYAYPGGMLLTSSQE